MSLVKLALLAAFIILMATAAEGIMKHSTHVALTTQLGDEL